MIQIEYTLYYNVSFEIHGKNVSFEIHGKKLPFGVAHR